MGRYEYFCPITGERITTRTQTSDSHAPQQFYSPGASVEDIELHEAREQQRAEARGEKFTPAFSRHAHQVRAEVRPV